MTQKKLFLLSFICLFSLFAQSQKFKNVTLGFEIGSNTITGEMNERWAVRQDVGSNSYSSEYTNSSVNASSDFYYVGIKPEISFFDNRLGIMSGIRLTRINSYLGKVGFSSDDFFYLRYATSLTSTNYARVNYVNENNDYIGIPLEVRVYPVYYNSWGAYLKVGSEFNFNLRSKTDLVFSTKEMENSQQEILDYVGVKHNSMFSTLYGAVGLRIGRPGKINYNFEVSLPSLILTSNNSSIVTPAFYNGVQFMIQFPLGKKTEKETTNSYNR